MQCRKTIGAYQFWRKKIPEYKGNLKRFLKQLHYFKLPPESVTGLIREFRAYWWLCKKYPNDQVAITTTKEDVLGVDIIIERNKEFEPEFIKFAVSGPLDKEKHENCNYKVIVSSKKITLSKVGKNDSN